MKIVLATPLYPPEIASPAIYIKELAERLKDSHEIVIVAYASTSERISGTTLLTVSKRRPIPMRLIKYFLTLYRAAKGADVIYVQNAVAAGLPAVLVGSLRSIPVILRFVGDEAWEQAFREHKTKKSLEAFLADPDGGLYATLVRTIQRFALRNATFVTASSAHLPSLLVRSYGLDAKRIVVHSPFARKPIVLPSFGAPAPQKESQEKFSWETHLEELLRLFETVRAKPRN